MQKKKYSGQVFGKPDAPGCWKSKWSSSQDCGDCHALDLTERRYCFWKIIFLAKSGKKVDVTKTAECPMNKWCSIYEWQKK